MTTTTTTGSMTVGGTLDYEKWKKYIDEFNDSAKQVPVYPQPAQHMCPSCGYCPCCGRGGYRTYPASPWVWPYATYTVNCSG